ncbi:MAG TPA: ROK family protein [Vicinamibacterales bacterium]|nr:ROK family protein [Vicinamibacterales bacterium]
MRILVIDIGGTHIKLLASGRREPVRIPSGPRMTPKKMVRLVKDAVRGWKYDVVSIGYPGPVARGRPISDPKNLGEGWVGFDFHKAFGRPVRILNDAAMQALGSYRGGHMLFLGLGTGLGTAMIVDGVIEPMELAHLPYKKGRSYEDYAGAAGLERFGKKRWRKHATDIIVRLQAALEANDVVVGGGNAKLLKKLPPGVRLGGNEHAFAGGFRMWRHAAARTRGR